MSARVIAIFEGGVTLLKPYLGVNSALLHMGYPAEGAAKAQLLTAGSALVACAVGSALPGSGGHFQPGQGPVGVVANLDSECF